MMNLLLVAIAMLGVAIVCGGLLVASQRQLTAGWNELHARTAALDAARWPPVPAGLVEEIEEAERAELARCRAERDEFYQAVRLADDWALYVARTVSAGGRPLSLLRWVERQREGRNEYRVWIVQE